MPGLLGLFEQGGGDLFLADVFAVGCRRNNMAFIVTRSMTPSNLSSLPIGHCMRIGVAVHLFADLGDDALGIGAGAVHLVDERQPRHVIALHLAIDGERLRLHAADGAEHQHRPVQNAEAALDLDGEIDVARRVDQVDRVVFPLDGGGGAGDGDAAFAFEIHIVHRGPPFPLDLLDAMDAAGIVENPLAQGRFARVDVSRNADIS